MSCLRVIQAGVGGRGGSFLGQVSDSDRFEHVAFVDVSNESLAKARETVPLADDRCFHSLEDALSEVECDAVFVITPPQLHAPQCNMALDAGKHVLVEKPFTKSLVDARAIVAKAEANGLCVVVTQNRRYGVREIAVRRLLESGGYGRVCAGSICASGMRGRVHHSGEDEHAYLWERGIHDLDTLLHYVAPRRAVRVSAKSFNPPFSPYKGGASSYGWIEFDDGSVFSLTLSLMSHGGCYEFVIDCEKAAITVGSQTQVHPEDGEPETVTEDIPGHRGELHCVLEALYEYVTQGIEPPISGRNNLATIELVESLARSSDENRVMELSP